MSTSGSPAPAEFPLPSRPRAVAEALNLRPDEVREPPPPDPSQTRHNVALIVLWGYLALLTVAVLTPLLLLTFRGTTVDDATRVLVALTGSLSGLVGILGYVIGYYFKGEDIKKAAQTQAAESPPTRSRTPRTTRS